MTGVDTSLLREYAELRRRQKDRTAEADALKKEADKIQEQILEQFAEAGLESTRISMPDGTKRTIYLHRQLWARVPEGVDKAAVCDAFTQIGLDHFVTESFNTQTVSAWMRDLEREEQPLPAELEGLLSGVEVFSVRDRKG